MDTSPENLSAYIGEHVAGFAEILDALSINSRTGMSADVAQEISAHLKALAYSLKERHAVAVIHDTEHFIAAIKDQCQTSAGCAYLAGDEGVRAANSAAAAGNLLQAICHGASLSAGWWIDLKSGVSYLDEVRGNTRFGKALVAEKLCLVHSEVSEGMEGHRKGKMDDHLPHRKMIEVELADAVIRIGDLAGALELDLGGAIAEKLAYNHDRPDHKLEARASAGGKAY